jgi:hypothetical protein
MLSIDALCEEFKDEHEENAIELFARLNKGGTSLSAGDVEAARLSQEATSHIVGPMRDFVSGAGTPKAWIEFCFCYPNTHNNTQRKFQFFETTHQLGCGCARR